MKIEEALNDIRKIVKQYLESSERKEEDQKIRLMVPSYGLDEIVESIESLLSTYVTMGRKVYEFEKLFSQYLRVDFGTMVNSGSSANLIALEVLSNPKIDNSIQRGDEVITPALTWSTTVFPILDIGAKPVFVDCNKDTLTIDVEQLSNSLSEKTKAIMPVHLLGHPCDMGYILDFAEDHDLFVIEDCCEAHGAEWNKKKVGSFGDIGTFSFFFSHHISTIEGGITVTNNSMFNNLTKTLRAHGWVRERADKDEIVQDINNIDSRFLFVNKGYNLRPTEIQGAFGIHQIKKLEEFIRIREENANFWLEELSDFEKYLQLPHIDENIRHVWFGFPLIVREEAAFNRNDIVNFMESKNIETRPIMAGNMEKQPVMKFFDYRKIGDLENSTNIMNRGFFFGNHQGIRENKREYISECIKEFLKKYQK